MERLQLPTNLMRSINWVSEQCDLHPNTQKMIVNEKVVCPRCELEKDTQKLSQKFGEQFANYEKNKRYNVFKKDSVILDETLLDATLDNFSTEHPEEIANKQTVLECLDHYKQGKTFNLVLQGKQGTGKSHLTHGVLDALNETRSCSCLFISIDQMIRLIKQSFNDKQSKYTESYFVELLSSVDYLGLDDLGAETGAIDTDKTATDFVQRVLYGVASARQSKSTILTTNLSSENLFKMYDKKLVSRLLRSPKVVIFKDSKDKRTSSLPF